MNAQEQAIFNAGVKGELRSAGIMTDETPDEKAEDIATLYIDKWLSDPEIENFFNDNGVVDCLVHFKGWLKDAPKLDTSTITPVNITMTIVIPIGDRASVQLGMSALPGTDLGAAFVECYDSLVEAGRFLRTKRLKTTSGEGSNGSGGATSGNTERIHVSSVKVERKNGKTYYRCAGGRWVKFGVPVWKEVMDASGINFGSFEQGENPVSFDAVLELADDGKPKKVIQIISK